uniref:Transmembrane protein 141 n=1 Tax=Molossus molossus TaxID=27622 RepID=A0A7J8EGT1_MOLMO|nr:transmembrane protein 141 [Molossus molossus]
MGTVPLGRHRFDLRPADVRSEEVQVPLSVERAGGRGCRLSGQLLGDPCGDTEVQQPLALPGDGKAPHRQGHRSAHLGELQPGRTRPGPGEFRNTALGTSTPQASSPRPVGRLVEDFYTPWCRHSLSGARCRWACGTNKRLAPFPN